MTDKPSLLSDFWWLPKNVTTKNLLVGVGHHKEVTDDEDIPPLDSWFHSLDQKGNLSNNIAYYPTRSLNGWRSVCNNTNVYRSLKVFDKNTGTAIFLGPFLIDIDNSSKNLNDAQAATKQVVNYLIKQIRLSPEDIRIFFSGRKGFNVEVHPQALEINGSILDQIRLSSKKLDDVIAVLRNNNNIQDSSKNIVGGQGTVIDRIYGDRFGYRLKHPYIRLHNSINKWIQYDSKEVSRCKIEVTIEQLWSLSASEIAIESEKLALIGCRGQI